jgi:hypothetical protein
MTPPLPNWGDVSQHRRGSRPSPLTHGNAFGAGTSSSLAMMSMTSSSSSSSQTADGSVVHTGVGPKAATVLVMSHPDSIAEDDIGEIAAEVDLEDDSGLAEGDEMSSGVASGVATPGGGGSEIDSTGANDGYDDGDDDGDDGAGPLLSRKPLPLPSTSQGDLPQYADANDMALELIEEELERLNSLPETPEVKARMQEIFLRLEQALEFELEGTGQLEDGDVPVSVRADVDEAMAAFESKSGAEDDQVSRTVLRRASAVMLTQMRMNEELFGAGEDGSGATLATTGWESIMR